VSFILIFEVVLVMETTCAATLTEVLGLIAVLTVLRQKIVM